MSRLEARYRRVLRVLPASYREAWGEEMVATLLESVGSGDTERAEATSGHGRLGWSEVASVPALAIRLRLGAPGAPPRVVAWGSALRLAALMGLLAHAAFTDRAVYLANFALVGSAWPYTAIGLYTAEAVAVGAVAVPR